MGLIYDESVPEVKPEQQKILDEIAAEEASKAPKVEETPKEEPKPEEKPVMPEEPKEEVKEEEESDEEDSEFADENEEDDHSSRRPKFVRLEKHLKIRDRVKELEAQLADYQKPKSEPTPVEQQAMVDEVEEFAKANGYDAEQTRKLVDMAEKGAYKKLEQMFASKFAQLDEVAQKAKQEREVAEQENIWNTQFNDLIKQFPDSKEHIDSLKGTIKKYAFSKEFHQAPLEAIYAYLKEVKGMKPAEKSKTVESGQGGAKTQDVTLDFDRIVRENDESAIRSMSSDVFAQFSDYIKKNNF